MLSAMLLTHTVCTLLMVINVTWAVEQRNFRQLRENLEREATADELFELFKITFGKVYPNTTDGTYRRDLFRSSVGAIRKHNELYKSKQSSFSMGINQFADMTNDEMPKCMFDLGPKSSRVERQAVPGEGNPSRECQDYLDWRDTPKLVKPVEHQVGTIEAQLYQKHDRDVVLSKQQVIDCKVGCNATTADIVYGYIRAAGGLMSQNDYKYKGRKEECKFNAELLVPGTAVIKWDELTNGDEEALKSAICEYGPVTVGVYSNLDSFKHFSGGIFDVPDCPKYTTHRMLAVGYGLDPDHWILKNSWGTTWGDEGYMKLARNRDNLCGVASKVAYPTLGDQEGASSTGETPQPEGPVEGSAKDGSAGAAIVHDQPKLVFTILALLLPWFPGLTQMIC